MTAEFATVMPAVILVLAFCLAGAQLAGQQLRMQDAAAAAARSVARGQALSAITPQLARLVPRASASQSAGGGLVCVTVTLPGSPGVLTSAITLRATSCALDGGQ